MTTSRAASLTWGRFVERIREGPESQEERDEQLEEYGWELLGPNPL